MSAQSATTKDPTLGAGIHAGASTLGFFAALGSAWAARKFSVSEDTATELAGAVGALAASLVHYIHARITYANPG